MSVACINNPTLAKKQFNKVQAIGVASLHFPSWEHELISSLVFSNPWGSGQDETFNDVGWVIDLNRIAFPREER